MESMLSNTSGKSVDSVVDGSTRRGADEDGGDDDDRDGAENDNDEGATEDENVMMEVWTRISLSCLGFVVIRQRYFNSIPCAPVALHPDVPPLRPNRYTLTRAQMIAHMERLILKGEVGPLGAAAGAHPGGLIAGQTTPIRADGGSTSGTVAPVGDSSFFTRRAPTHHRR